jgi:hypothetical protein
VRVWGGMSVSEREREREREEDGRRVEGGTTRVRKEKRKAGSE